MRRSFSSTSFSKDSMTVRPRRTCCERCGCEVLVALFSDGARYHDVEVTLQFLNADQCHNEENACGVSRVC